MCMYRMVMNECDRPDRGEAGRGAGRESNGTQTIGQIFVLILQMSFASSPFLSLTLHPYNFSRKSTFVMHIFRGNAISDHPKVIFSGIAGTFFYVHHNGIDIELRASGWLYPGSSSDHAVNYCVQFAFVHRSGH